jgi:1,4-dihydroxy-2-naphthoate polyprenyltransferase
VSPGQVRWAAIAAFSAAAITGVALSLAVDWRLVLVGAACLLAGWLYTGGPRPYGYEGLGELFVFLFFGVVAVTGSYYVQTEELTWLAFALSVPVGLLAAAILVVNNIRDVDTDRRAGKRTLAVRLGRERARRLFAVAVTLPFAIVIGIAIADSRFELLLALLAAPLVVPLIRTVATRTDGPALNGALARCGALLAVFSVLLSIGLLLS